ncbi:MAG: hypothetical protein Q8L60_05115 [Gammaproteobacteria bacterium]|nr:hypothetical protein [Gammaproteobacteria bacterium]MDP2140781.1 hypothetical protein [Gammaproteobacteria bacterium]MDP2347035.1 hypothetical protein [Gammaproteobacteria bacterium]
MTGEIDKKDKDESRKIAIALISLVLVAVIGALLLLPALGEIVSVHFSPGLGMRDAAVISFFITIALLIVFAISSGDGLLGELQFMLGGFFAFFVIIWLMIAWVF